MLKTIVIYVVGCVLLLGGVALMVGTGYIAVSLGVESPVPAIGGSDLTAFMEFFRQLTFIRMFAVAAIGFSAICFWAGSQLTPAQQTSFLGLLVGVFAVMGAMAVAQQVAIWNRGTGWALVGVLCALLLTSLAAVVYEKATRRRLASA
ncbi:MAG: hypothetical protein OXH70_06770 [Acidobacteria bacterium]|nr:hypothetical protein [Acidobacteriota bacterium]